MNVDHILDVLNARKVEYILIGGMNYLLRHEPVLTYDVDIWINDTEKNRKRCESALVELGAEWGRTEKEWGPVANRPRGWLGQQVLYALTSPHGSIDVFRSVRGLGDWRGAASRADRAKTSGGKRYRSLSDADMLASQLALDEADRKQDRIKTLRAAIRNKGSHG